ncbi:MAG: twin-arginine translocase TatA/TatE family subunit [Chlamydiae bacterium]|nr:twin-arginine translocase TatA/TatE family subunit [Chlamydiota bacterium]
MFGRIGWTEILIVLTILLILFGPKRIPELAKSIGQGIRLFKKGLKDVEKDVKSEEKEEK